MHCHKHGMIGFSDSVRDGHALFGGPRDKVHQLYPPAKKMAALVRGDTERFLAAPAAGQCQRPRRAVYGNTELARALGIPSSLSPEATRKDRNDELRKRMDNPNTRVDAGRISTSRESPFAVEILVVDRKEAPDPARGRPAHKRKNGLAFVPIQRGELYRVRIFNKAPFDAAVRLSIDGLDQFVFSNASMVLDGKPLPLRNKNGRPRYNYRIVPSGKSIVVAGWFRDLKTFDYFNVTAYARSAAAELRAPDDGVGQIVVQFHACWEKDADKPADEQSKDAGGDATGRVPGGKQAWSRCGGKWACCATRSRCVTRASEAHKPGAPATGHDPRAGVPGHKPGAPATGSNPRWRLCPRAGAWGLCPRAAPGACVPRWRLGLYNVPVYFSGNSTSEVVVMFPRRGLLVLLPLLTFLFAAEPPKPRKVALLIGVKDYKGTGLGNLKYCENDVDDLAAVLVAQGYDRDLVVRLTQSAAFKKENRELFPTAKNIRAYLKGLIEDLRDDDTVLIAFSGHGVHLKEAKDKGLFFCPMECDLSKRDTLVSLAEVYEQLDKQCKAKVKLLVVDACRNDPTDGKGGDERLESSTRPLVPDPPGGIAAFFSCSTGQQSFESDELKHGLFTYHFIQGLKGRAAFRDREVTVPSLEDYLAREVPLAVKKEKGIRRGRCRNGRGGCAVGWCWRRRVRTSRCGRRRRSTASVRRSCSSSGRSTWVAR